MNIRARTNPESGKTWVIVVVVVVLVFIAGVFLLGRWGLGLVGDQVKADIKDNPVILEHIGEITDISMNLAATGEADDDETFVFDLVGTKGSGQLTAVLETVDSETEKVRAGSLRMKGGTSYDLFPK